MCCLRIDRRNYLRRLIRCNWHFILITNFQFQSNQNRLCLSSIEFKAMIGKWLSMFTLSMFIFGIWNLKPRDRDFFWKNHFTRLLVSRHCRKHIRKFSELFFLVSVIWGVDCITVNEASWRSCFADFGGFWYQLNND